MGDFSMLNWLKYEGAGVQDGLGGLFDFGLLGIGGGGPGEAVVDNILGVAVITFNTTTYCS